MQKMFDIEKAEEFPEANGKDQASCYKSTFTGCNFKSAANASNERSLIQTLQTIVVLIDIAFCIS